MVTSGTDGGEAPCDRGLQRLLDAFTGIAPLAGYGRRWMGRATLRAINVIAAVVFFGFAARLLWKLAQTLR